LPMLKFSLKRPSPRNSPRNPFTMADSILQRIHDMRVTKEDPPMLTPPAQEASTEPLFDIFWNLPSIEVCGIGHLPSELIVRIFSFLDISDLSTCAQVCRFFSSIAMDGSLWRTLDFSLRGYYRRITTNQLQVLAFVAGGFLRLANFRGCLALTSNAVGVYSEYCPNIRNLDMQGCLGVNSISLSNLVMKLQNLHTINVTGLAAVGNLFLELLGSCCGGTLKVLKIGFCKNVSKLGLKSLLSQTVNVEELSVAKIQVLDQDTLEVMGKLRHLQKLDMRASTVTPRALTMFLSTLAETQFVKNGNLYATPTCKLIDLKLSGNVHLTDVVMYALGTYTPLLETLEVEGCKLMTDAGIASLTSGKALPGHVVDIDHIHHRGSGCEKLRNLDLEDLNLLTDEALRFIGSSSCAMTVQRLSLGGMEEISDAGVISLIKQCKHLMTIDLDNCARLTDALVEDLVRMRLRARQASAMAKAARMDASDSRRQDSGYGEFNSVMSSPTIASAPLLNTPLSSSPGSVYQDVWEMPPTTHLVRVELFDCRGVSREACRFLEKRGGLDVGSFYTSRFSSERRDDGTTRRRGIAVTRMTSCSIL
jgi:hypothetical protein